MIPALFRLAKFGLVALFLALMVVVFVFVLIRLTRWIANFIGTEFADEVDWLKGVFSWARRK